uniref:Disintegrin and metalloproteinase domain-containing protein 5 n=1 Tax=Rhinopithecus roxellana TaxID=61622 RepID=A0A2K6PD55_RHIRO
MGSDINAVTQKVIQIIGLVNTMLTQLQLTVIISSIEIWSNKNKISTTGHAEDVLLQFFEWKKDHLNFKPHQIAYLFVYRKLPILIGATFPGQICNKDFAAAVALNCTHKLCCEPLTCRLKGNALCGSGDCCSKDCKFKPANTICRKSVDEECDFTEFCNGSHPYCLLDTYVRDGEYCDSGGAFCFQGRCRTFDKQCDDLIGRGSRGAPIFCYDEINTRGDKFGNCGTEYCLFQHILCGKLVCTWEHRDLISRPNLSVIYAHVRDQTCVSTYLPRRKPPPVQASVSSTSYYSVDDRDETFVQDGSVCGPDMYCFKMRCKHVRFLMNFEMCEASNHCNGHGVCNNFNHCHCEKGYNPPYCQPKKEAFGSIDDGHLVPTG